MRSVATRLERLEIEEALAEARAADIERSCRVRREVPIKYHPESTLRKLVIELHESGLSNDAIFSRVRESWPELIGRLAKEYHAEFVAMGWHEEDISQMYPQQKTEADIRLATDERIAEFVAEHVKNKEAPR